MKWNILNSSQPATINDVVNVLLENRGITNETDKKVFFNPKQPDKFSLEELEIDGKQISKSIKRLEAAKKSKESILIYGDYDADGVCSTAILWEALYASGFDVQPYIPDRFTDGYGLNASKVLELKKENPNIKLVITVDNGIVANEAVEEIQKKGINVIVTDHHQVSQQLPPAHAIVHTDKIAGSGVAWVFTNELYKAGIVNSPPALDLVAIGTIADILPLIGPNRSFVKYGLEELNQVKRPGIVQLCLQAGINADQIGVYEVGYVIAPRINSMGRLKSALDSLRLVCTKKLTTAKELATNVSQTNLERQKIVEEVVAQANVLAEQSTTSAIIIAHESFHEGVIGLAASKLVEKYYRPSIVISKGETIAKASARSIEGFNIIEHIRKVEHLIIEGGGHPQAAGFSIEVSKIEEFIKCFNDGCADTLTDDLFIRNLKIDAEVQFSLLNWDMLRELEKFEPTGNGNKQPIFKTNLVNVKQFKALGQEGKHLKLSLEQGGKKFDAIGFNLGKYASTLTNGQKIDIAYSLEENIWNGNTSLQLKLKDIHTGNEQ